MYGEVEASFIIIMNSMDSFVDALVNGKELEIKDILMIIRPYVYLTLYGWASVSLAPYLMSRIGRLFGFAWSPNFLLS